MKRKKYENESLGVKFSMPGSLTLREHNAYRTRLIDNLGQDATTRQWFAVLPLIEDWECELILDPVALDLDKPATWKVADVLQWVTNTAVGHLLEMDDVDPN